MIRYVQLLRESVGSVFHEVDRESWGEVVYPIGVALTFWLADGNAIHFIIPMLILTLADAVAALIGISYGQQHYEGTQGRKSWEGSIAFFVVAFFSVHVPLLLGTETGRAETLLIAVILGIVLMLVEAVSWRGLDNLFRPLLTVALLQRCESLSPESLTIRLIVLAGLFGFLWLRRGKTTFEHAALIGAGLFGYATWMLGSPVLLLPCLGLFLVHQYINMQPRVQAQTRLDFWAMVAVASPGMFWLLLPLAELTTPSLAALGFGMVFTSHIVFVGISHFSLWLTPARRVVRLAMWIVCPWIALWLPYITLLHVTSKPVDITFNMAMGLPAMIAGVIVFIFGNWLAKRWVIFNRIHWCGSVSSMASSSFYLLLSQLQ